MKMLHLDAIGGIAGDMFAAALLDAFPEHESAVIAACERAAPVSCKLDRYRDHVLTGRRFRVSETGHHDHDHDHDHQHRHAAWRDIRASLAAADLPEGCRTHADGIFARLAQAEGAVHGIAPDDVSFHEVGAADSIADIVAAGFLIDVLGPARWSVSALPLGGGRVNTAHGVMPIPAPATTLLLRGFAMQDDGVAGERVTPTGAAILAYLEAGEAGGRAGRLTRAGTGFGTRALPGISNCLRVLCFEEAGAEPGALHRTLAVIAFEVDDQSPEDLAAGLHRIRAMDGVHDAIQMAAFGKKGRMATHIQVLARPDAQDAAIEACFRETTTIGLRVHQVSGIALPRRSATVSVDGHDVRVKHVDRPGGPTCKAESDDVLAYPSHAKRARIRRAAETDCLKQELT